MSTDFERIWSGPIHREFLESLDQGQIAALWRLLLVATFADDELSIEERREIAGALAAVEGFDAAVELDTDEMTTELELLYVRYESDPEELLEEISKALLDDRARRHAFRTVVQLMQSDGFVAAEEGFTRLLGKNLGLEPEVIDFAIGDARQS